MVNSKKQMDKILELAFNHNLSPIAILDKNFNFIKVNEAYAKADNKDISDFLGRNHFDLYPSKNVVIFEEVLKTKKACHFFAKPFLYEKNPERGITYWDWSLVPILGKTGEVEYLMLTLKDVTTSEKAKIDIENFLELSSDLMCNSDFELKFNRTNPAFMKLLGFTKEELIDKNFIDFVHDNDKKKMLLAREKALATGQPVNLEIRIRAKDCTYKWIDWSCVPQMDHSKFYCIGRDVTEHKKIREKLLSMKERFSKAFNASPSLMIIQEFKTGGIIEANRSFLRIIGYGLNEVIGRTTLELGLWLNTQQRELIRSKIIKNGYLENIEITFNSKSDTVHTGLYSAELFTIQNKTYLLASINDITNIKKVEKEMARLDQLNLVGQMAAGIGHEVRNPLTTVRGFLQILSSKEECTKYKEYYSLMIEELDRANSIITEFLSLAKNKPDNLQKNNLKNIIENIAPLIEAEARRQDKLLSLDLEEVPEILSNEKEIRQLVLNLVHNGLEAMPVSGKLTIKTRIESNKVILSISDEGPGINPEVLEKIGTPFFTTKSKGTGLGLAVCYSIVERHKAKIDIVTNSKGTTFNVLFPKSLRLIG